MEELRFDGRVAIVTGAGGNPSLGRAHALLLAARGAHVVVNDIGHDPELPGYAGRASADAVAAEIVAAGGCAVANALSIAEEEGAQAIVRHAVDAFGRLDILVNNAGVAIAAPFDVMTARDFKRHIDVNLMGAYYLCRAAWPHMKAQGYGRIVNTTSSAMTGFKSQVAYGASKGAVWSLTRGLAAEGLAHGIRVNAVSPGAFSRMVSAMLQDDSPFLQFTQSNLPAELVSPALAYLCHEGCPVTGECIDAAGGEVQRTFIAKTKGFSARPLTIETVAARWDEVMGAAHAAPVELASFDTDEWKLRPYQKER